MSDDTLAVDSRLQTFNAAAGAAGVAASEGGRGDATAAVVAASIVAVMARHGKPLR